MKNIIEIQNLTKNYGKHRGVENVSFSVREGEIFGFLGPNGAGKSTTIRAMLGLIQYKQGQIFIGGFDVKKEKEKILQMVGYMPSEAWFYPGMTIKEVLKLSADVRNVDCSVEAEKLCERLQIDGKRKINELSLGNRKKVSIVCAMQHKPKLFLFDEPTSGLDPLMQNVFFELIREYVKAGATCMLSTHILSEIRNYCDRVAIMKEGKLIVTDTVEHLLSSKSKHIKMIRDGEKLDFIYKGDLNELYKELEGHNIEDILIEEPSIEEVFMHYYEKEGNEHVCNF
ncbi:MAG: ABC transporter ATP-binding protein [Blautia sp.]|nr:ABC transporter ATP-binding protein [Bacillota bacterium]MDY3715230.1 ABC transporter ATP-binding protein [Blautia sp.]